MRLSHHFGTSHLKKCSFMLVDLTRLRHVTPVKELLRSLITLKYNSSSQCVGRSIFGHVSKIS